MSKRFLFCIALLIFCCSNVYAQSADLALDGSIAATDEDRGSALMQAQEQAIIEAARRRAEAGLTPEQRTIDQLTSQCEAEKQDCWNQHPFDAQWVCQPRFDQCLQSIEAKY